MLVGHCYLEGVMFGEALLGPFSDPWACMRDSGLRRHWCFGNRHAGKLTLEDPDFGHYHPHGRSIIVTWTLRMVPVLETARITARTALCAAAIS